MTHDIYATVTNQIIEKLKQGIIPWQRPWNPALCAGPSAPVNFVTGHQYSGINVLLLGMHPSAFATGDPGFCTYKQAADRGYQVRKGEKSTSIVFYRPLEVDNDKHDPTSENSPATRMVGLLRTFSVFHRSQIDGAPPYVAPTVEECPWLRPDAARTILENSGAVVRIGGDRAFYSPGTDHIQLPPDHAFSGPEYWATVALHELSHWTGASHRMNRDLTGAKGSAKYAEEELRAETCSAFLGATLNIPAAIDNHASYVGHYISILKKDKRAIFHAAADAQKIADYLLHFHPDYKVAHEDKPDFPVPRPSPAPALLTA